MDADALYDRMLAIQDRKSSGFSLPIMRHLVFRGHEGAMMALAHWYTAGNGPRDLDGAGDLFTAANLYRRAWRNGSAWAAHSLAMSYFNRGDMANFRLWARRGARLGDYNCQTYTKHFETRLPHHAARKIRRHRPEGKRDQWA